MTRPTTTLVLPISADGKLVSRDAITTDKDPSWRLKPGVIGYLQQFYDFATSDSYTLTTGEVMTLSGVNHKTSVSEKEDLNLVVLDFNHAITDAGVSYLEQTVNHLVLIKDPLTPKQIMAHLSKLKIKKITIHSTPMNTLWLQSDLVDYLTLIIYPLIVGESGTPVTTLGLTDPKTLTLLETTTFDKNYLCLRYKIDFAK